MSQAATTAPSRKTPTAKAPLASRIGFTALGVLLVGGVLYCATMYFGNVSGEEFSPDKFQRRVFAYVEVPLIRFQVTPISRRSTTGDLERYLVTNKLIDTAGLEPRWDLVFANTGQHGEARILCTYLDARDDQGKEVWLSWSENHVELAKILWPAVAKLAGQELYSFVPDLFVLARTATDAEVFKRELDQAMARNYVFVGRALQAVDNHERAVEFFSEALTQDPDLASALEGRAESYQAMGDTASADADRIRRQAIADKHAADQAAE